jgi:hypothetical protein
MKKTSLTTKPRNQPEQRTQDNAQNDAGHDRKINTSVPALPGNVSWKAPESEWELPRKIKESPDSSEHRAEHEQCSTEFTNGHHRGILLETGTADIADKAKCPEVSSFVRCAE